MGPDYVLQNGEGVPIRIVRLDEQHLTRLLEVERLSFAQPWSEESYRRELTENRLAHYYGCLCGEELLAYAGFWQILDEGHIANVAVHPQARGRGLGEALVRYIMAACRALGGGSMTLEVRRGNVAAQRLYRRLGFSEAGCRPHYYDDNGEDALIMWVDLAAPQQVE